jgi:hypothetical protein
MPSEEGMGNSLANTKIHKGIDFFGPFYAW